MAVRSFWNPPYPYFLPPTTSCAGVMCLPSFLLSTSKSLFRNPYAFPPRTFVHDVSSRLFFALHSRCPWLFPTHASSAWWPLLSASTQSLKLASKVDSNVLLFPPPQAFDPSLPFPLTFGCLGSRLSLPFSYFPFYIFPFCIFFVQCNF